MDHGHDRAVDPGVEPDVVAVPRQDFLDRCRAAPDLRTLAPTIDDEQRALGLLVTRRRQVREHDDPGRIPGQREPVVVHVLGRPDERALTRPEVDEFQPHDVVVFRTARPLRPNGPAGSSGDVGRPCRARSGRRRGCIDHEDGACDAIDDSEPPPPDGAARVLDRLGQHQVAGRGEALRPPPGFGTERPGRPGRDVDDQVFLPGLLCLGCRGPLPPIDRPDPWPRHPGDVPAPQRPAGRDLGRFDDGAVGSAAHGEGHRTAWIHLPAYLALAGARAAGHQSGGRSPVERLYEQVEVVGVENLVEDDGAAGRGGGSRAHRDRDDDGAGDHGHADQEDDRARDPHESKAFHGVCRSFSDARPGRRATRGSVV